MKKIAVILGDPRKPDISKLNGVFGKEDYEVIRLLKVTLSELKNYEFSYFDDHNTIKDDLYKSRNEIDLAFNLCDEGFENKAKNEKFIPIMLNNRGIKYTGAGARCMELCYNKNNIIELAKQNNIPVQKSRLIQRKNSESKVNLDMQFPLIIKPNFGDGSFGITRESKIYNQTDLEEKLSKNNYPLLVQEFLEGMELSCGIIGNKDDFLVLITEEDYSEVPENLPRLNCHEAKHDPNSPYNKIKTIKADIPDELKEAITEYSLNLFNLTECKDYARVDWRLNRSGNPKLLEINPNPGWCWDGHLAKMCNLNGISYSQMLEMIIKTAEKRLQ